MNFPRRTYYYKPKKTPSDPVLINRMEQICLDFPKYGYRRVTEQLKRERWLINHKKIHRIMREKGWLCRPRKKNWVCTTDSNHKLPVYPNLIKELTLDRINQLWVADITYIHILWYALFACRWSWMCIPEKRSVMPSLVHRYTADIICFAHDYRQPEPTAGMYSPFR